MVSPSFRLYRHDVPKANEPGLLTARQIPEALGNHRASAPFYQASPELETAVNAALAVGAPLLLTGEPGTGKTQVAFHIAHFFGLDLENDLFSLFVRSTTTYKDLLYEFDAVAYFRAAHEPGATSSHLDRERFITHGPLWRAFARDHPAVLLVDEVDKAPRDFPNDLLNVLDQHRFYVKEADRWIERGPFPPMVVITSNSERRLPEPFLRRCIFHHIEFTEDLVRRAVKARGHDFPHLSDELANIAVERFMELRATGIRKRPATAELLVWLTVLNARGDITADALRGVPLAELPALSAIVKDREDLALLS